MSVPVVRPRCPVCGQDLARDPWRCAQCDTPHHRDCAEYFGGCAIFGCRDGRAPAPLEVATWPRVLSMVRWFVLARRLQTWNMLGFFAGMGSLLLAATAGRAFDPLMAACILLMFGCGALLGPTYVISSLLHERIVSQLGRDSALVASLSARQLQRGVPRLHSPVLRAFIRSGLLVSLAGLGVGMYAWSALADFSVFGLMMIGAVQVVVATTDEALALFTNRLKATLERDSKKAALPDASTGTG